jgi:RimJ/RimL family protein N-acetyltransferase
MNTPQRPISLSDHNLKLRPYKYSDVPLITEAVQETLDEAMPYIPWMHADYDDEDAELFVDYARTAWRDGQEYAFAITDQETGQFLGGAGINFINEAYENANMGYWVRSAHHNKGVATAAARLVAWFGLEELELQRLELLIQPENQGSIRVAEKLGAQREGLQRDKVVIRGEAYDSLMYSLVRADMGRLLGDGYM